MKSQMIRNAFNLWIPYLQYELSKFKDKWPKDFKRNYKPIVRKSKINIR